MLRPAHLYNVIPSPLIMILCLCLHRIATSPGVCPQHLNCLLLMAAVVAWVNVHTYCHLEPFTNVTCICYCLCICSALAEYQHLALYLRAGSSLPERTLAQECDITSTEKGQEIEDQTQRNLRRRKNLITEAPPPLGKDQECVVLYSVLASKVYLNNHFISHSYCKKLQLKLFS